MVSEQVATATVFLGAHASSLHRRGDAKGGHGAFQKRDCSIVNVKLTHASAINVCTVQMTKSNIQRRL